MKKILVFALLILSALIRTGHTTFALIVLKPCPHNQKSGYPILVLMVLLKKRSTSFTRRTIKWFFTICINKSRDPEQTNLVNLLF